MVIGSQQDSFMYPICSLFLQSTDYQFKLHSTSESDGCTGGARSAPNAEHKFCIVTREY
jgi:hypothetical protein